jgi:S-adenosylmethionine hydrolase
MASLRRPVSIGTREVIVLFTDYGFTGPYVGQLKAALARDAPGVPILDLQHDAPRHDPHAAAYLLAALIGEMPEHAIVVAVVDPGVGARRRGAILRADGRWLVGPDNGLFNVVLQRAKRAEWWDIDWQPARLSATFHGRDLFAPVAARLARDADPPGHSVPTAHREIAGWPSDLAEILYIDHFGNAMTGLRGSSLAAGRRWLRCRGTDFPWARTFSDVSEGSGFWYVNSIGLVEFAANRRSVSELYGIELGDPVDTQTGHLQRGQ